MCHALQELVPTEQIVSSIGTKRNRRDLLQSAGVQPRKVARLVGTTASGKGGKFHGGGAVAGRTSEDTPDSELHKRLLCHGVNSVFKTASGNLAGSAGGHGVGGSISPIGVVKILKATDSRRRYVVDMGGGNRLLLAHACYYGCSDACAYELPENKGNFLIFRTALKKLEENLFLNGCKGDCMFTLSSKALVAKDINQVVNVDLFDFTVCP